MSDAAMDASAQMTTKDLQEKEVVKEVRMGGKRLLVGKLKKKMGSRRPTMMKKMKMKKMT